MAAGLSGQVGSDGFDDELCPLDRRGSVAGGVGGAGGDDFSNFQLMVAVDRGAVRFGARSLFDESTAGLAVDLDVPLAVALTKRKAVSINVSGPVFGREAAVMMNRYPVVCGQPIGELVVRRRGLLAFQRAPECFWNGAPLRSALSVTRVTT